MKGIRKLSALFSRFIGERPTLRNILGVMSATIGTLLIFGSGTACTLTALALLAIGTTALAGKEGATA